MVYMIKTNVTLLVSLLLIPFVFGEFAAYQIGLFLIYGIAGQGIGYLWGRAGILPFGQAAFFGIAAYGSAHVLRSVPSLPLQIACMILIILAVALIAFLLASIVFRGRTDSGPFFSLITLALAIIAEQIAGTATNLTGGFNGLGGFQPLANLDQFGSLYYLIVAAVIVTTATLMSLDKLPVGLVARALADNEKRLQLFGFRTHLIKGGVFALSAAIAAIAGILFANHQGIVTPVSTGFLLSANLVIWTAVGGRYHVLGPLIGSVAIGLLSAELRDSFVYWEVILALIFIVVVLKAPGGFAEFMHQFVKRMRPQKVKAIDPIENVPDTRASKDAATLTFRDAWVQVGPVRILNGLNLQTPERGIVCVIGPNGAGKTSLLNAITGHLPLKTGDLKFGQSEIQNRAPYCALNSGIARKLQVPSVFSSLTVSENLAISMFAGRAKFSDFFRSRTLRWRSSRINALLNRPSLPLKGALFQSASDLPQGHRQFLEFAMTSATDPRVLLLDEPCAGLSPSETRLMTELLREFQDENQGLVLLIEHDMSIVRSLSDHLVVMHQGAVLAEGNYAEIRENKDVKAVYAGGTK